MYRLLYTFIDAYSVYDPLMFFPNTKTGAEESDKSADGGT